MSDDQRRSGATSLGMQPVVWLATGFGFGYAPVASGTFGAIWGLPLTWAVGQIPALGPIGALWLQGAAIVVLFAVGVPICSRAVPLLGGDKDPGAIVWDEIASMPIVFFLIPWSSFEAPTTMIVVLVGFVLHRLFDISKPPPCRQLERLPSGLGIMADDSMAAVYACLVLHGLLWAWRAT